MQKINLTPKNKQKLETLLKKYQDAGKTYSNFSRNRKDAYLYTRTINVRACPYCNINYTYTVYNILRPDIDHFEPQCKKANLTLQQNNLIPSCQQCNSRIKLRKKFSASTHIHPYLDDFNAIKKFSIDLKTTSYLSTESFDLIFKDTATASKNQLTRAERSIKDLGLEKRYYYHKEDVVDLFKKAKYYSKSRLKEIEDILDTKQLELALFSHRHKDINQAPLSKLTNDILDIIL